MPEHDIEHLSARLDKMEANVAERDKKNRADIHDLRGGQQVILDKVSMLQTDLAPYVGSVNLLKEMRDDLRTVTTRMSAVEKNLVVNTTATETTKSLTEEFAKKNSKMFRNFMAIVGLLISIIGVMKGCGPEIKNAAKAMIAQNTHTITATDKDSSVAQDY